MVADHQTTVLQPARTLLSAATSPLFTIADLPYASFERVAALVRMASENRRLESELLATAVERQRIAALEQENAQLRTLLESSARVARRLLFAEVIGLSPDPRREMLVLDKGQGAGVSEGLAVLDSSGLVGQVIEAGLLDSRVLLITDLSHSTPVQILRNDFRAILRGTGDSGRLQLQHVPDTADVRSGDVLMTSGLGGRFPAGYPVAVVDSVRHDTGAPFAEVVARPTAKLSRSRHLVIVTDPEAGAPIEATAPESESAVPDAVGPQAVVPQAVAPQAVAPQPGSSGSAALTPVSVPPEQGTGSDAVSAAGGDRERDPVAADVDRPEEPSP